MTPHPDKLWFTSDNHFGHANIIRYLNRPFSDVEHMTEEMVRRWNACVQPDHEVYIVGDFCWKAASYGIAVVERLNGRKHLVRGNHDRGCLGSRRFRDLFVEIEDILTVKVPDGDAPPRFGGVQRVVLCHYAMQVWEHSHHGAWMLHGHSHGALSSPLTMKRLDVGADCWHYAPVSYGEVKAEMARRTFAPVDGHGATDREDSEQG